MDSLLLMQNPAVIRLKGRPIGARGRGNRSQQAHEDSTQRDPSQFEHVLTEVEVEVILVKMPLQPLFRQKQGHLQHFGCSYSSG